MPPSSLARLVPWIYLGDDRVVLNGYAPAPLVDAHDLAGLIVEINAYGGDVRFAINAIASGDSAGRIPEDQSRIIGPLQNWQSLGLFGTAGTEALILYFHEV